MPNTSQSLKYVVVDPERPVVFPMELLHADVATSFTVRSAGFCRLSYEGARARVKCWGESTSLGLRSREASDAQLIELLFSPPPAPLGHAASHP